MEMCYNVLSENDMDERREHRRFDPAGEIVGYFHLKTELTGEFPDRHEFVIKDISLRGFHVQSNFSPLIGQTYPVYIKYPFQKNEFEIIIIHSHIARIEEQANGVLKPGPVFSIGCQIIYVSEAQKSLIQKIIDTECLSQDPAPK